MTRSYGEIKRKIRSRNGGLDLEHELPAGDGDEGSSAIGSGSPQPVANARPEAELQKLKAERDSLLDRLARAQAEFENARRRAAKEQQDFRDYAAADAIKRCCRCSTASSARCR